MGNIQTPIRNAYLFLGRFEVEEQNDVHGRFLLNCVSAANAAEVVQRVRRELPTSCLLASALLRMTGHDRNTFSRAANESIRLALTIDFFPEEALALAAHLLAPCRLIEAQVNASLRQAQSGISTQ